MVRRSYALTVLAVAWLVLVPGPPVYLFVALTSAGLYVPFSLHITLGQDFLPRRVGTASGVTLGLTVSVGGLAAPALGALADATSLRTALLALVALPARADCCCTGCASRCHRGPRCPSGRIRRSRWPGEGVRGSGTACRRHPTGSGTPAAPGRALPRRDMTDRSRGPAGAHAAPARAD